PPRANLPPGVIRSWKWRADLQPGGKTIWRSKGPTGTGCLISACDAVYGLKQALTRRFVKNVLPAGKGRDIKCPCLPIFHSRSPRNRPPVAKEKAGEVCGRLGGQPDDGVRALFGTARRARSAHVGVDPAGTDGIDSDTL